MNRFAILYENRFTKVAALQMCHRLAHRVGHSSRATPAYVDRALSASSTRIPTVPPTRLGAVGHRPRPQAMAVGFCHGGDNTPQVPHHHDLSVQDKRHGIAAANPQGCGKRQS